MWLNGGIFSLFLSGLSSYIYSITKMQISWILWKLRALSLSVNIPLTYFTVFHCSFTLYLDPYVRSNSVSSGLKDMPGVLVIILVYTASLGCTRITSSLRLHAPLKMSPGTSLNWIRTSALRSFRAAKRKMKIVYQKLFTCIVKWRPNITTWKKIKLLQNKLNIYKNARTQYIFKGILDFSGKWLSVRLSVLNFPCLVKLCRDYTTLTLIQFAHPRWKLWFWTNIPIESIHVSNRTYHKGDWYT